jgi:hypothetical protein
MVATVTNDDTGTLYRTKQALSMAIPTSHSDNHIWRTFILGKDEIVLLLEITDRDFPTQVKEMEWVMAYFLHKDLICRWAWMGEINFDNYFVKL